MAFPNPMSFDTIDFYQKLAKDILDRPRDRNWVNDVEAFLEYRVPQLLDEIHQLKCDLKHTH